MMTAAEYAKYTLDNLSRATLGNALNIASKIDTENCYKFKDFIDGLNDYSLKLLENANSDLDKNKCFDLLHTINKYDKMYNDDTVKYNKYFIIDNLIIDLWDITNRG